MAVGTIHPVDDCLYWVEGRISSAGQVSQAGCAVLWTPDRIYLTNAGHGPEQRASVAAVVASFPPPQELALLDSDAHHSRADQDGLMQLLPTAHRRSLIPRHFEPEMDLVWGSTDWIGSSMDADTVMLLRARPHSVRTCRYFPSRRVLTLPDHTRPRVVHLAAAVTEHDRESLEVDARVATMLAEEFVSIVLPPFGRPWDRSSALAALDGFGVQSSIVTRNREPPEPPAPVEAVETQPHT